MKISTLSFLRSAAMFLCGASIISLLWAALSDNCVTAVTFFALTIIFYIGSLYYDDLIGDVYEKLSDLKNAGYRSMNQSEINISSKDDLKRCIKVNGHYYIKKEK